MLLSATSRKGQPDPDLHPVQNPEHALVSNKQEGLARSWLTSCSKPRACSCQQWAGRASQTLTYKLFKTQSMLLSAKSRKGQPDLGLQPVQNPSMLLSATSRKGQLDPDLQSVQNPEHFLVSNKQKGPARSWLTCCWKPRTCSCQQQAGRASQILTYRLFKTQSMLLSATSRKGQPDPDLHPVQNPEHAFVSNKQRVSQILTYKLFKTQSILLSAKGRKGHPDPDLQTVQNPEHALVSNKQEGPARFWLTTCSKPKACSCQQQAGRASQILTYILLKTQSMLLSATSRKGQPDPDLQPVQNTSMLLSATSRKSQPDPDLQAVQNPEHALVSNRKGQLDPDLHAVQNPEYALVSNKQERPARFWLTICWKPRACSCQQQAARASQILTYKLFKTRACSCQQQARRASQIMTYILFKTQRMLLSATSRKGHQDPDLQAVQNPEHALVSKKQEGPARSWLTSCSKSRACSCQQQAGRASQILTYKLFKPKAYFCQHQRVSPSTILTYILFTTKAHSC